MTNETKTQEPLKIYISGQITGLNFQEAKGMFERGEREAITLFSCICGGDNERIKPINPMKLDHAPGSEWEDYMEKDIAELLRCQGIYMLQNWRRSKGARVEHAIAKELGLPIIYQTDEF